MPGRQLDGLCRVPECCRRIAEQDVKLRQMRVQSTQCVGLHGRFAGDAQ